MKKAAVPSVEVDDRPVPLATLIRVASDRPQVALSAGPRWRRRIEASRRVLDRALEAGAAVYGVSTGVGNSSWRMITPAEQAAHTRSVWAHHGCGVGDPFSELEGRAIVFARVVALSKGLSAVRLPLLDALVRLLNRGIIPVIPRWGSVGASGDLTPLSYVVAVLAGEREAYHRGRVVPAAKALAAEGLSPFVFAPKETLSIMNGTSVMTAVGILTAARLARMIAWGERASALLVEVLEGRSSSFDRRLHLAKPHPGQIESARNIRKAIAGSRLVDPRENGKRQVQDRYSVRCSPHVLGAARDAVRWANQLLEIELNGATDNPIVDPDTNAVLFGGNFFGGHPAMAMDLLKIIGASMADLFDRQFALLVDADHNQGLPETLVSYGGCGVKGLQITCSALTTLAVQRATPDSTLSRSTECSNQDKVSMGLHAVLNAGEIATHLGHILATEFIALSNAAALREASRLSPSARAVLQRIRRLSPVLTQDRRFDRDIKKIAEWLEQAEVPA